MPSQKGGHYQTRPNRKKDLQTKYDHAKKIENQSRVVNWSTPCPSLTPPCAALMIRRALALKAEEVLAWLQLARKQILITLGTTPESFRAS
jgi:hypothetical protein